jgi:hypothetical protein
MFQSTISNLQTEKGVNGTKETLQLWGGGEERKRRVSEKEWKTQQRRPSDNDREMDGVISFTEKENWIERDKNEGGIVRRRGFLDVLCKFYSVDFFYVHVSLMGQRNRKLEDTIIQTLEQISTLMQDRTT